jgi:hypothetical protein
LKRISTILLFTVAVAIVLLYAANQVMAVDPISCNTSSGGYSIITVPDPETGAWPIPHNGGWLYRYNITGNLSKITHTAFGIPYISEAESIDVGGDLIQSYNPVGAGSSFSTFGDYIFTARIVDLSLASPIPGTEGIRTEYVANTSKVGQIGGVIITAKGIYGCAEGVPGPVPESLDPEPQVLTFTRTADGHTCELIVTLHPFGVVANPPGECSVGPVQDIEDLGIFSTVGTAVEMQDGWFSFTGSPTEYCYYNKKKRKYICVTY